MDEWQTARIGIGPIIVALDAEYPAADLIIAAGLDAAEHATCRVAPEISEKCIIPVAVGPEAAYIAADIASGPGEIGDHRGRGRVYRCPPRKVRRAGRAAQQGSHSEASK